MPRPSHGSYRLTHALAAAHSPGVVCLADAAYGKTYALHASRPAYVRAHDLIPARGQMFGDASALADDGVIVPESPALACVTISGPTETRAGYHGDCGGWSDGYDAIGDRMVDALADADVLLTFEEAPGGAVLGIVECVDRVLAAKALYQRRIYVIVSSGMAASAAYWLACSFADPGEFYASAGSLLGSIGARAAHVSEAGALAQAGLEVTDFAYPPGKVALSPSRPLNETGTARGKRDVMAAVDSFFGAVTKARPWLNRAALIALDADMRIGLAAQSAGLCDGVATREDVEAWALSRAGENMILTNQAAEDMPPAKPGATPPPPADDPAACAKCKDPMPSGANYCAKCGASVSAAPPADDDEAPPSSKPAPKMPPADASAATMLGLRPGASDVAIKTAIHALQTEIGYVRHALAADSFPSVRGKMTATLQDARQGVRAAQDLARERAAANERRRIDALTALAKANLPGFPPGDLLIPTVGPNGNEIGPPTAAGLYASTPVAELEAFVKTKLANAGPTAKEGNPYVAQPSDDKARPGAHITTKIAELASTTGISAKSLSEAEAYINSTIGAAQ